MIRVLQDEIGRAGLNDFSAVHHADSLADPANDPEVVRDHDHRQTVPALKLRHEIEDLRGNTDVERGNRFIEDQESWRRRERAGDGDALPLTAGKGTRVLLCGVYGQPDLQEHVGHPLSALRHCADVVGVQRFGDDVTGREARIEGGARVLKDCLEVSAQRPHSGLWKIADGDAVESYGAAVRLFEREEESGEGRFPRSRFADHAEGLAGLHREADAVDRRMHEGPAAGPTATPIRSGEVFGDE